MSTRRILVAVLLLAAAISIAGSFVKDAIVRKLIVKAVSSSGGFEISIDDLHFGLLVPTLELTGVKILNPPDFPVRDAVAIDRLFLRYDRMSLFGRRDHIPEIDLNLSKVVLIRNNDGEVNLEMLASPKHDGKKNDDSSSRQIPIAGPSSGTTIPASTSGVAKSRQPMSSFQFPSVAIDRLRIRLGELDYYDYSLGREPMVIPAKMNFDQTFTGVTNMMDIAGQLGSQLQLGDIMGATSGFSRHHGEGKKSDHDVEQQIENVIHGL